MSDLATIHPLARCGWCGSPFVLQRPILEGVQTREMWFCPSAPCYPRQLAYAMVAKPRKSPHPTLRFVPLPRQVDALDALAGRPIYILLGGAAGGSKSKGLRESAHRECLKHPHFKVLLLRRTFGELQSNHIDDSMIEAPEMEAECVPSAKVVRYQNGSILQFGHCETAADAAKYLSSEYDLIIFDELVTFEETQFLLISSRARSTKPGITPKILAGTNPGGPQSHWVRSRFIDKTVDPEQFPDYQPDDWCFIPSKLEDNPYLDQQYERKLLSLPPELRKAYRDGDWDIFPGQYFPEWRRATHVSADHRVIPGEVERVLALDWGFVKPGSCGWWALVDGHAYREEEYIFTRTTAFEVGKEIARRCKERSLTHIKYLVFDTAMEIPQNDTGESTIETVRRGLRAGGLSMQTVQADKDRVNGWQRLRHWLGKAPDGRPWLESSPACPYFNRTMPAMVSDATKPEDVDTDGEDHAADEARYFAMSRPRPGTVTKSQPVKEWSLSWLKSRQSAPSGPLAGREVRVA